MRAILWGSVPMPGRVASQIFRSLDLMSKDLLIAVDGGLKEWAKLGVRPHFAIGDWDSLSKKARKLLRGSGKLPHVSLPRSKDRSDLFYAAIAAIEAGAQELVCVGVTGGRLDHHLATLLDLSEFSSGRYGELRRVEARGSEGGYYFLSEKIPCWTGCFKKGQLVSVFGMKGGARGVTLTGFKYGLKDAVLGPSSYGLSNLTSQKQCQVRLRKGQLLVMVPGGHS